MKRLGVTGLRAPRFHARANAPPRAQQALRAQMADGLAHRMAADPEFFREFLFRRQQAAHGKLILGDTLRQHVRHLYIQWLAVGALLDHVPSRAPNARPGTGGLYIVPCGLSWSCTCHTR